MTCEEFRTLTKDPTECTAAERTAAAYHRYYCISCSVNLVAQCKGKIATDRDDIDELVARDQLDAEVQSIMKPIWDNCKGCGE